MAEAEIIARVLLAEIVAEGGQVWILAQRHGGSDDLPPMLRDSMRVDGDREVIA